MKLKYLKDNARHETILQRIEATMRQAGVSIHSTSNGIIVTFEDDGELTQYRVADVDFDVDFAHLPGCNTFPRTVDSEKLIVEE